MNKIIILTLFLLIISSCSSFNHHSNRNINSIALLRDINERSTDLSLPENLEYIDSIEYLRYADISDSSDYSFNDMLTEVEEAANFQNFINNFSESKHFSSYEIVIIELQFRLLTALQYNSYRIYSELQPGMKFENTIIFASTNTNISEVKTYLLNRLFEIYHHSPNGGLKELCLPALKRMLLEIDLNKSEDKMVQRSPFGVLMDKNEIILKFNEIIADENNSTLKKNVEETRDYILFNCADYKDLTGNIVVEDLSNLGNTPQINKEAIKLFNTAAEVNDPIERIQIYSNAIELDSNFIAAFNNRGISHFEDNDFNSAANDFQTVINLNPSFTAAYSVLGNCFMKLTDYSSAIEYYNLAIASGEDTYSNYNNRGLCFYKMNHNQEAWNDFSSAIQLDSLSVSAYANRAICSIAINNMEWAKKDYKKLIEIEPGKSQHYYNLGCILYKLNELDKVYEVWSKGLEVNSKDILILKNIKNIKNIKGRLNIKDKQ